MIKIVNLTWDENGEILECPDGVTMDNGNNSTADESLPGQLVFCIPGTVLAG